MTEKPPGRADRVVDWLQRVNDQYAAFMRWLAAGGIIYATIAGRADFLGAFVGLFSMTLVVGRPRE